jgi:hypothetical protein
VKVKYGATKWNAFAYGYQEAFRDISLAANLEAITGDEALSNTVGNNFTIDGQNHILDAKNISALGFTLHNKKLELQDMSFKNFGSITDGSVMAINGGQITIKAENGNVLFEGNKANGVNNDIALQGTAALELNAASGKTITMNGGILGSGATINKTGDGDLRFNAGSSIAFDGTFSVNAGRAIFSTNAYIHILNIASNTILGLNADFIGNSSSILYLDTIISTGSNLLINNVINPIIGSSVAVIYAKNPSAPDSFYNIIGGVYQYSFDWTGTNFNWVGYLRLVSIAITNQDISRLKFLANSLSLAAKSHGLDDIYGRLDVSVGEKGDAWLGLYGGGRNADDFSIDSFGGAMGADLYKNQNFVGGLFIRYGSNDIKEKDNKGTMGETEFGIYGGLFEIFNSPINARANISMGIQNYSMEVGETVDFNAAAVKGGFEVEYESPLTPTIKIKPFIGFQSGYAMNNDIKTNAGIIKSDSLLRMETKIGLGLSGQLWQIENFKWYSRLYGIFLISGSEPKYKTIDNNGNENETLGAAAKEGIIQGAISVGGEYQIGEAISVFISAGADFGAGLGWMGGAGINYKFGAPAALDIAQ